MKDSNKSPNTRRSMPVLNAEHESHLKRGLDSSIEEITKLERSNSVMNQRDMLLHERDKAVEEWTKATAKWEQLLDEVEKLMTEVSLVKTENEEKGQELSEVITAYEEDLDKRDFDLQVLRERYIDLNEQVHVARKERLLTLTQYDDLLKKHYDLNKEFQEKKAEVATLDGRLREAEQKVNSLQQQVDICKHDRDHALRLWNSSVEERKKLHHEMASLIQARDASIRTAFNQAEEIIQIKDERDKLQRDLDSAIRRSAEDSTRVATSDRNDSGYSADQDVTQGLSEIPETEPSSPTSICVTTEEERTDEEDCEVFAVSVDKMDSKFGLKVDNAVDDPRVYITHVNSNTAARNNIRKYDRIISVNGVTVVKADKKTVDRLIRDCSGRLTLVLQRDKLADEWNSRYRDLELHWAKHSSESHLGLRCNVTVTDVNNAPLIIGSDEIQPGDIIHKINSQDISSMIASFIRKLSKKSGGKVTVRLKRNTEGAEDTDRAQGNQIRSPYNLKAPSVHSDTSSLSVCSFSSGQTSTTYNEDCTSLSSIDGNEDSRSYKIRSFGLSSKLKQLSNSLSFDHDELQLSLTLPRRKAYDRTVSDLGRVDSKRITAGAQPSLERAKSETCKFADPAENLYESLNTRLLEQQLSRSSLESEKHRRRSMYANRNSFLAAQNRPDFEAWKRQSLILAAMQQPGSGNVAGSPTEENVSVDIPRVESNSTLPRLVKRKNSVKTNEKRTSHRVLRLEKESHEDLGFRIQGGNRSGIFVAEIREGSIASKSGLLPGDKILHMNSYDFTSATMDYAMKVLLSHSSALHFRIEVFQDPRYQEILNDEPLDSVYVRTRRSFEASKPEEMSFVPGEILHVTNTLAEFKKEARSWQWFAEKWRHGHATGEKGLIPSLEIFSDNDEAVLSASDAELGKSDEEVASSHGVNSKRQKKTTDVRKWLLSRKPSLKKKREKERKQELMNNDAQLAFYEILVEPPITRINDEIGSPETEGS